MVCALQILGTDQQLLQSLTVNIQHLWPDVDLAPAVNPSQAERRRMAADSKLKQWPVRSLGSISGR